MLRLSPETAVNQDSGETSVCSRQRKNRRELSPTLPADLPSDSPERISDQPIGVGSVDGGPLVRPEALRVESLQIRPWRASCPKSCKWRWRCCADHRFGVDDPRRVPNAIHHGVGPREDLQSLFRFDAIPAIASCGVYGHRRNEESSQSDPVRGFPHARATLGSEHFSGGVAFQDPGDLSDGFAF